MVFVRRWRADLAVPAGVASLHGAAVAVPRFVFTAASPG
jgi:hypothetical protein